MYGLEIPEILMNIMSCHGFTKSSTLTVILTCRSALVPYYFSKGFVIFETEVGGVDNILTTEKLQIRADDLHQEESFIACNTDIPSIVNTFHKPPISRDVYEKYAFKFYDNRHVDLYNLEFNCFFMQSLD